MDKYIGKFVFVDNAWYKIVGKYGSRDYSIEAVDDFFTTSTMGVTESLLIRLGVYDSTDVMDFIRGYTSEE